ncbi:MAG TPA: aldolase/citrate lyase family protein [Caulobacteraceae bacterium]|jgi:2-keto-3-deoxy-L-rhamnonate aldolase RhmA
MAAIHIPDPRLKTWLASETAVGCHWLALGAPVLAELAADAGAQSIVFDAQHGRWGRDALENAVAAVGGRAPTLVRAADATDFSISWALDAGVQGIIVPMISSAAACAEVVAASRFPPHGRRSGGGARPMLDFGAYRKATAETLVVGIMIETREGVDAAEAIAATHGLDLIFIGPSDLSLALGGGPGTPVFDAALKRVLAAGEAAGVPVGIYTADAAQAAQRAGEGFRFVVTASDTGLNRGAAKAIWDAWPRGAGGQG